jgi:hypothetical protein
MNFAGPDWKRHVVESPDARERLADAAQFEQRRSRTAVTFRWSNGGEIRHARDRTHVAGRHKGAPPMLWPKIVTHPPRSSF